MIPGEIGVAVGEVVLKEGLEGVSLGVANTGDRSVQVGSHCHFAATDPALSFDRLVRLGRAGFGGAVMEELE